MKLNIQTSAAVFKTAAVFLMTIHLISCDSKDPNQKDDSSQSLDVRHVPKVLISGSAEESRHSREIETEAKLMWLTNKELDLGSKGPVVLAGRFLTDPPDWGSYVGVSQTTVENENGVLMYNSIHLKITSLDAIDMLKLHAQEHKYDDAIIVVFTDEDWDTDFAPAIFEYEEAKSMLDAATVP